MWIKPRIAEILITNMGPTEIIDVSRIDDPVTKDLVEHKNDAPPIMLTVTLASSGDLGVLAVPEIKKFGEDVVYKYKQQIISEAEKLINTFTTVDESVRGTYSEAKLDIISLRVIAQQDTIALGLSIGITSVNGKFLGVIVVGSEDRTLTVPAEEPFIVLLQDVIASAEKAMLSAIIGDSDGTENK